MSSQKATEGQGDVVNCSAMTTTLQPSSESSAHKLNLSINQLGKLEVEYWKNPTFRSATEYNALALRMQISSDLVASWFIQRHWTRLQLQQEMEKIEVVDLLDSSSSDESNKMDTQETGVPEVVGSVCSPRECSRYFFSCVIMANTLMCTERMDSRRAEHDPVVFADQRVLHNLLISERYSMINIDYFAAVQHDITGHMRRIVVNWMMERVELMLLRQLEWNLSLVTPSDFVEHVLSRVPWVKESPLLRRHAHLLLQLCCADHEIIQVRPSAVASGCIIAAARGLRIPSFSKVAQHVCALTRVDEADANAVEERVEALVREEEARHVAVQPRTSAPSVSSSQPLKPNSTGMPGNGSIPLDIFIDDEAMDQSSQPETPTDIQDIHF
ncbi:hypothetical protein B566_EDAN003139 [Ephemera danica]|nr:hypothetical protein B566_EDAN003139 [Ephemera danica]